MYKYSLDKSSKKFICPNCEKKTFVRYIDNQTNEFVEYNFGRCDRETNCRYHISPERNAVIQSFHSNPNKIKSRIDYNEIKVHCKNFKNNNLIQFLKIYFSTNEIKSMILKYHIGTSDYWIGSTIFWQITNKNELVTGKVMLYNIDTGKRVKTPFNHINWIHKIKKINNFELKQCLFGLHLINEFSNNKIALVESEKTAIMMSVFLPNYTWLATGSKSNLKKEMLEPVKKFDITVFPDKSEFEDWNKKVIQLKLNGFEIKCSNFLEKNEIENGSDLADLYIQSRLKDIALETEISYTNAEIKIKRLAQINPEIKNLIKTFDRSSFL